MLNDRFSDYITRERERLNRKCGAVELRISNVVDIPNFIVSALLPEAIFDDD